MLKNIAKGTTDPVVALVWFGGFSFVGLVWFSILGLVGLFGRVGLVGLVW